MSKTLKDVHREGLTRDREVTAMLNGNKPLLKALVTKDGDIFYVSVDPSYARVVKILVDTVIRVIGKHSKTCITPLEYDEWHASDNSSRKGKQDVVSIVHDSIDWIFTQAINNQASDVYLFLNRKKPSRIDYKVYGNKQVLIDTIDSEQAYRLASLIWSVADSQFDSSKPCDASFPFTCNNKMFRVRVNSIRTSDGGNVVACRIRDPKEIRSLNELGYSTRQLDDIAAICNAPGGLILFTGATNSGKSTSVTSLMAAVPITQHMIEIADPVEIILDNCVHLQIDRYHKDHDQIFARLLASLVRQNPDVLVLGEIRDERTAEAAISMAIQGKRVFSTLHSTTAAGVFSRLSGLGVKNHILALPEFISGIVSQNLVPTPCSSCALRYEDVKRTCSKYETDILNRLKTTNMVFINRRGCAQCASGVSGQTLVAEVHPYTICPGEVHQLIMQKEFFRLETLMHQAYNVLPKMKHALHKIESGLIDPLETFRIVGGFTGGHTHVVDNMSSSLHLV